MSDMIGAPLFPFSLPSDVPLFPDEINHTFFLCQHYRINRKF